MPCLSVHSPLGPLTIVEDDDAIVALDWCWTREMTETSLLSLASDQLTSYFEGDLTKFTLPLAPSGTPFQCQVWASMKRIPYGETQSYGGVAEKTAAVSSLSIMLLALVSWTTKRERTWGLSPSPLLT